MTGDNQNKTDQTIIQTEADKSESITAASGKDSFVVSTNLDITEDGKTQPLLGKEIYICGYMIAAVVLLLLDVLVLFISAKSYFCFVSSFDLTKTNNANLGFSFSVFSIFWFAITALAVTVVSKILYTLAEEIRLQTSRTYLKSIIQLGIKLPSGLSVKDLFDLASRSAFVSEKSKSEEKLINLPIEKLIDTVNELVKSVKDK